MGENALKLLVGLGAAFFGVAMGVDVFAPTGYKAAKDVQHLAGQDEHKQVKIHKGLFKTTMADVNLYTGDVQFYKKSNKKKGGK